MKPRGHDSKSAVLQALKEVGGSAGASRIREKLLTRGLDIQPRTVRLYLLQLDQEGLTRLVSRRHGRVLTGRGEQELAHANIVEKIGFIGPRIDSLVYQMNYDLLTQQGTIIANTALLSARDLAWATEVMRPVFRHRFGMGTRLGVVREGQVFAGTTVPAGMVLLATACSVTVNGVFLKHGIPVTSRYGGLLEVRQWRPFRFVALIDYGGTTLDPLEAFIRAKMTRVRDCARTGNGIIGVSFREVPTPALAEVARIKKAMNEQGLDGILAVGTPNQPLLDVPVAEGRAGLVIAGGLNPLAALHESASLPKFHSLADVVDQGLLPPLRL